MRIQVVGYVVGLSRKRVKGDANKERNGGVSMSRGQYRQKYGLPYRYAEIQKMKKEYYNK